MPKKERTISEIIQLAKDREKLRRVDLNLTEGSVSIADLIAKIDHSSRSKVVRDALELYLGKRLADVELKRKQLLADVEAVKKAEKILKIELAARALKEAQQRRHRK